MRPNSAGRSAGQYKADFLTSKSLRRIFLQRGDATQRAIRPPPPLGVYVSWLGVGGQRGAMDRVAVGERLCLKKEERNQKKRGTSLREDAGNYYYGVTHTLFLIKVAVFRLMR